MILTESVKEPSLQNWSTELKLAVKTWLTEEQKLSYFIITKTESHFCSANHFWQANLKGRVPSQILVKSTFRFRKKLVVKSLQ